MRVSVVSSLARRSLPWKVLRKYGVVCECAKRVGGWRFFRVRKSVIRLDYVCTPDRLDTFFKRTSSGWPDTLETVSTAFPCGLVELAGDDVGAK